MHTFAIQMQLECVHMKMWHYVGIYMQLYILFSGKKKVMVIISFKYRLLLKQEKPWLYKELPLINDTFDKIQIPAEEIACL